MPKTPFSSKFTREDALGAAAKCSAKPARTRGRPYMVGQGIIQGYRFGTGSVHRLGLLHLRCIATASSGQRCKNMACRINRENGIQLCHFHAGPHDPSRRVMKLRRLRGEFVSSGWTRKARNRRISQDYFEMLLQQAQDAMSTVQRHDRRNFNLFVRRCLNTLRDRLADLPDRAGAAVELIVQITVSDCLSGRRPWRNARDLEDQVVDAVTSIVHLSEEAADVDKHRQI